MKTLDEIQKSSACPLMLGTAQFGLDYGIANTTGKPAYEISRDIVQCAYEGGVDCLDTAAAYGDSEDIIGKILVDLHLRDKMMVATKIPAIPDITSAAEVKSWVDNSLDHSRKRLGLDPLPLVLLHRENDYEIAYGYLEQAAQDGRILAAGVSGGSYPDVTSGIVTKAKIAALQIPINMFDKRFTSTTGVLSDAAAAGIAVFSRSAYWKGLAVMPIEQIESKGSFFADVIPIRKQLDAVAKQSGVTIFEMAMQYVLSHAGVTRLLVGIETVEQMKQNLEIASRGPLSSDIIEEIDSIIPTIPNNLIDPFHWPIQ